VCSIRLCGLHPIESRSSQSCSDVKQCTAHAAAALQPSSGGAAGRPRRGCGNQLTLASRAGSRALAGALGRAASWALGRGTSCISLGPDLVQLNGGLRALIISLGTCNEHPSMRMVAIGEIQAFPDNRSFKLWRPYSSYPTWLLPICERQVVERARPPRRQAVLAHGWLLLQNRRQQASATPQ
jgi:hypothetical protein